MKNRDTINEVRSWVALAVAVISMTAGVYSCNKKNNPTESKNIIINISTQYQFTTGFK